MRLPSRFIILCERGDPFRYRRAAVIVKTQNPASRLIHQLDIQKVLQVLALEKMMQIANEKI